MTRLYLAGPMRGHDQLNFPTFHSATARLREYGYDVFNPAEASQPGLDVRYCLATDLAWICHLADGIATLPGWRTSLGARAEIALADALHIPAMPFGEWVLRAKRAGVQVA